MKIQRECVPCLLKRCIYEAKESTADVKIQTQAIQNACKTLAKYYDPSACSAEIATKVHKVVYDSLGDEDPYKELKRESNAVAASLLPKVEDLVKSSKQPLKTAMMCSIIGNMLDFGISGGSSKPDVLKDIFQKTYDEGLGHDNYNNIENLLKTSKNIVLFTDNCGEVVFDKLLCRELKKLNPGIFLTLVVKGKKILSDATIEDAKEFSFEEVVDEILTTGCFAVGVDFANLPSNVESRLKQADIIICKGMANYEAFSETNYKPIAYLLRTKCTAIANSMNLPLNINAIKLYI